MPENEGKKLSASVRASTIADYEGIAGVWRRNGLGCLSREDYELRYARNPFVPPGAAGQTGWVLESAERGIVGTFGNIYSPYELNGKVLMSAATHAVAVDAEFRHCSMPLLIRFFRQPYVDLLLATTANQKIGELYLVLKAQRLPHPSYDQVSYWITEYRGFAAAMLRRKGASGALGLPAAAGLWCRDALSGRLGRSRVDWREKTPSLVDGFDERFDELWAALRRQTGRLLAVRSRIALSWHYAEAMKSRRLAILALEQGRALSGYIILIRRDAPEIGLQRWAIADLQLREPDPAAAAALITGALREAKRRGIHVVETNGFEPFKKGQIERFKPWKRTTPAFPYLYKAQNAELSAALARPEAWDPCLYDGDSAF